MTEGLFTLLLFSIVMAVASFAAGMLPLAVSLSQSQLRLISTLGMGLLVGTALIVIIPEGIETLYSVNPIQSNMKGTGVEARHLASDSIAIPFVGVVPREFYQRDETSDETGSGPAIPEPDKEESHDHDHDSESNPHKWVGFSLVSGFILMYLIDVLPRHAHRTPEPQPYHISIDNLNIRSLSASPPPDSPIDSERGLASTAKPASTTTLGLVIHAAADGIALGASSTSSNVALSAIIFLAIMLHKAPAAFGLSAVLLRAGLGKRQARAHLIVFSLAAPVGAIVTWILIGLLGGDHSNGNGIQWWTGILLLFSGGTFLYVAMHTIQEQAEQLRETGQKSTLRDVVVATIGMALPLATQVGHQH